MKRFGFPSGSGGHGYEKIESSKDQSKTSSLFHRIPQIFNKESWCRNCAYWLAPTPSMAVRSKYWRTNLVVAGDCPVCQEKRKLDVPLVHPWIRDFEKNNGIASAKLDYKEEITLAYWNDQRARSMAKLASHVKSLEKHHKVLTMCQDEFINQCRTVVHRWNKLESDRRAVNRGESVLRNRTWCRNCAYWVVPTYDPFSLNPRYKLWETRLFDSRDCPVCWIKIKLSTEITNDLLSNVDRNGFPAPKGNLLGIGRQHDSELPPKFWVELEKLKGGPLGASKMKPWEFEDRCNDLQGIWGELEADRRELEMKSQGRITS